MIDPLNNPFGEYYPNDYASLQNGCAQAYPPYQVTNWVNRGAPTKLELLNKKFPGFKFKRGSK